MTDVARARNVKLLVGVCGSVAALGTPHALLWARARVGLKDIRVVTTEMAQSLVTKRALEAVTQGPVLCGWEDAAAPGHAPHTALAAWADVVLILPASANFLGKVAAGIADDLLTSVVIAAECPVVVAPSMNPGMWKKPVVQRNVGQLREDGYEVIAPGTGLSLASDGLEGGSIEDVRGPILVALSKAIGEHDVSLEHEDQARNGVGE